MKWLLIFAVYTGLALLFTSQVFIDYSYAGSPITWGRAFGIALIDWYLWLFATPLVLWLAWRFPLTPGRWRRSLIAHIPASVVLTSLKLFANGTLVSALFPVRRQPFSFLKIHLTLFTYWAIVAIRAAVDQYQARRTRELHASRLEAELARAQVQTLRMQLQPHFLFNTLNAIAGLMREDVEAADLMLTRLSDLLRLTLDTADVQEVTLAQELEFLRRYLDIQQVRFGPRLAITIDIAPDTLDCLVPSLILQPLTENALRHGISTRPGPGLLIVRAAKERDRLRIVVEDDGPGPPPTPRDGYGLENTRARLHHLYGDSASLTLGARAAGGAAVELVLPCVP